jgi:hypothetical protein
MAKLWWTLVAGADFGINRLIDLETAEHTGRLKGLGPVNQPRMNEHCLRRITLGTCAFDGGAVTAGRVARLRTLGLLRARCMEPPGPERPKSR